MDYEDRLRLRVPIAIEKDRQFIPGVLGQENVRMEGGPHVTESDSNRRRPGVRLAFGIAVFCRGHA
jgi:hypothetical protein